MTPHQIAQFERRVHDLVRCGSGLKKSARLYFMLKQEAGMDTKKLRDGLLRDLAAVRSHNITPQDARSREGLARVILQSRELEFEYNGGEKIRL